LLREVVSKISSLCIRYDLAYLWGVTGVGDTTQLGTADKYVSDENLRNDPDLAAALPFLYAYEISRNCSKTKEDGCISIPSSATADNFRLYIPLSHPIGFAERMYDNPISHVGPSATEIVMPVHLHIKRKTP
jgi:hypothetical protein